MPPNTTNLAGATPRISRVIKTPVGRLDRGCSKPAKAWNPIPPLDGNLILDGFQDRIQGEMSRSKGHATFFPELPLKADT
ncbi:hypothetical protein [Acidiphilium acidophilum]|uniref:Uncharacterized protein n=1 Tax=Acidiphilium acidophilum TaxID=76588 RepID=A0AAW9DM64_ACIAO|nr:hypothetical protein [Acidiphilium acidophilum]MDX5929805.1 hypothetical protein [Acidiphilium acidophilum]